MYLNGFYVAAVVRENFSCCFFPLKSAPKVAILLSKKKKKINKLGQIKQNENKCIKKSFILLSLNSMEA